MYTSGGGVVGGFVAADRTDILKNFQMSNISPYQILTSAQLKKVRQ